MIGFLHHRLYRTPVQGDAQGQGVDKHPQYTIRPRAALQPSQQDRAKHHIIAAAGLCQHLRPRDVEQHTGADPQPARLRADRLRQRGIKQQAVGVNGTVIAGYFEYPEGSRGLVNLRQLAAKIGFMLRHGHPQCLGDKIAIGQQGGQGVGVALKHLGHLGKNQIQRDMVTDQMVEAQGE
ncbi:hypothetical protein Xkoz_03772 [Xenorhabdus kozodoii]|uniref:Uncharacterized protein n=1 Tax=Xenorhabdus kozodoii TaxID=351676 RepID=A0A2D0KX41_9GAMM|nr:hypothetical protein Xkoz_03772 [Xenorhabdus kozodoii]